MKTFTYESYPGCYIILDKYCYNGNTSIQIFDDEGLVTSATINVEFTGKLPENQAVLKSYSENEGLLEEFMRLKFIKDIIGFVPTGYVLSALVELDLDKIKEYSR